MARKLKALGVGLVAALAIGAVVASAASAAVFHFSAESTVLTGEALNTQVFEVTPGGTKFTCEKVSIAKGTVMGKTAEKITIKPKYEGCKALVNGSEFSASIDFTECAYEFTSGTNESEHAKVRTECPKEGEEIHLKVTGLNLQCIDIPGQEVTGIHYENMGETTENEQRTLDLNATATGLVTTTKGTCKFSEESEIHNNGSITGKFKLKGDNTINEPTDVSYS